MTPRVAPAAVKRSKLTQDAYFPCPADRNSLQLRMFGGFQWEKSSESMTASALQEVAIKSFERFLSHLGMIRDPRRAEGMLYKLRRIALTLQQELWLIHAARHVHRQSEKEIDLLSGTRKRRLG